MESIKLFFNEYGMFLYNTLTILLSLFALIKMYFIQPKQERYVLLLNEILLELKNLKAYCTELWCNPSLLNRAVYEQNITSTLKVISGNLTVIDNKFSKKIKCMTTYTNQLILIQTSATSSPFQTSSFRIDPERSKKINNEILSFEQDIKMLLN